MQGSSFALKPSKPRIVTNESIANDGRQVPAALDLPLNQIFLGYKYVPFDPKKVVKKDAENSDAVCRLASCFRSKVGWLTIHSTAGTTAFLQRRRRDSLGTTRSRRIADCRQRYRSGNRSAQTRSLGIPRGRIQAVYREEGPYRGQRRRSNRGHGRGQRLRIRVQRVRRG
jgi:hypothetical protein